MLVHATKGVICALLHTVFNVRLSILPGNLRGGETFHIEGPRWGKNSTGIVVLATKLMTLAFISFSFASSSAWAQSDAPVADVTPPVAQDCRAAPADQPAGADAPLPDVSKLADCGGVLKPPVSADGEMVENPEQGGKTPVIPPSQVPPDQGADE
jgi:hypothetical protein